MKRLTLNSVGTQAGFWVYVTLVAVALILLLNNDRISALTAGAIFAGIYTFSRYVLGFPIFSVPMLYLGMLALFHLGLVVPWALGIYDPWEVWWFRRVELTPALLLVILAFVCLQLGLIMGNRWQVKSPSPSKTSDKRNLLTDGKLVQVGIALLLLSIVVYLAGLYIIFGRNFLSIAYLDIYRLLQETDSRWYTGGLVLVPVGVYVSFAGASRKHMVLLLPLIAIWTLWNLILGFRGRALIVVLVLLFMLTKKGYKIPVGLLSAMLVVVLYLIPVVRSEREESTARRDYIGSLKEEAHPLRGIAEMGGSIWPLIETYRFTDARDFRYGKTYLYTLWTIVPNVSLRYKPGEGQRNLDMELSPARWFVWMINPELLEQQGGYGYSTIAEAYINLGYAGVAVFFFGLGLALVWMEQFSGRNSFALAGVTVVLAPLLWTVRNDYSVFTRAAAWGLGFVALAWLLCRVVMRYSPSVPTPVQGRALGRSARPLRQVAPPGMATK